MHPFDRALVTGARDVEGICRLLVALGLRVGPPPWSPLPLEPPGTLAACRLAGSHGALGACVGPAPEAGAADLARDVRRLAAASPGRRWLFLFHDAAFRWLTFVSRGVDGEVRRLEIRRQAPDATALEALAEMAARPGDGATALALRHARAMARGRITARFFTEFRAARAAVAQAWTGLGDEVRGDRDELALLLLCRLLFLHFVEARGWLDDDARYLAHLLERWLAAPAPGSFFRARLRLLFFDALGAPPSRRTSPASRLGRLPYLNGGLFARRTVERRHPDADLPDAAVTALFDGLFSRYRFSALEADAGAGEASIDPEMLGRVFEGLMDPGERGRTGTFYTPRAAVRALVVAALESHLSGFDPRGDEGGGPPGALKVPGASRAPRAARHGHDARGPTRRVSRCRQEEARRSRNSGEDGDAGTPVSIARILDGEAPPEAARARLAAALRDVRILDPAAGSGAFLLGALQLLVALRRACGDDADLAAGVRASLYGVDIKAEAVLLSMLRVWLALAVPGRAGEAVGPGPLPNLDRRLLQGDALVDPLEFAITAFGDVRRDAAAARALRAIETLRSRHFGSRGAAKEELERALAAAERSLAVTVLDGARRGLGARLKELKLLAASRDLFGGPAASRRDLDRLRETEARLADAEQRRRQCLEADELPFFSFRLHMSEIFARGGFDIVITNPPWVRPHRWSAGAGRGLRRRYSLLRAGAQALPSGKHGGAGGARASDATHAPDLLPWAPAVPGAADLECLPARGAREERCAAGSSALHGAQGDLSLAFLERALELLRPAGTLAILLPAKCLRALYGAAARERLVRETTLVSVEDHALDQNAIFDADSFVATLVLRKHPPPPGHRVHVRVTRRAGPAAEFRLKQARLPSREERGAPWLLAPPEVAGAMRTMQTAGEPLGHRLRVQRGVFTGANDVFLLRQAEAKLGGIVRAMSRAGEEAPDGRAHGAGHGGRRVRSRADGGDGRPGDGAADVDIHAEEEGAKDGVAAGAHRAPAETEIHVEAEVLRRVVRGAGIRPWRLEAPEHLLWLHGDGSVQPVAAPRLAAAYLARHRRRLDARSGARRLGFGAVFRVSPAVIGPKVLWHDLAERPAAVYAPDPVPCADGIARPLIPLNTAYFVVPPDPDAGHFLAALLNARPVATYLCAVAERAKDARFRFLAWTVASLPVPRAWRDAPEGRALVELSRRAHAEGGLDENGEAQVTELAAGLYGLTHAELTALLDWDRWLAGEA